MEKFCFVIFLVLALAGCSSSPVKAPSSTPPSKKMEPSIPYEFGEEENKNNSKAKQESHWEKEDSSPNELK